MKFTNGIIKQTAIESFRDEIGFAPKKNEISIKERVSDTKVIISCGSEDYELTMVYMGTLVKLVPPIED